MMPFRQILLPVVGIFCVVFPLHAGEQENLFIQAVIHGKLEQVQSFLQDQHVHIDAKDDENRTALISALHHDQNVIAKYLIDQGAAVNLKTNLVTPLMVTSWRGNLEITKILLKKGVDVNIRNQFGLTAILAAAGRGHFEIVKLLLEHGAKMNIRNKFGKTPLLAAREAGYAHIYQLLLEHGAIE